MLGTALRWVGRLHIVLVVLAVAALTCEPTVRRYGDRFQVVLPMLAWSCAAINKTGSEFATRLVGMLVVVHGTKNLLGDMVINQRPNGSDQGFPSGHTAAAAIGASALVNDCIAGDPITKGFVIMSAAFVGASRIDAGKHTIWQVFAGALLGWAFDRSLRRPSRLRSAVMRWLSAFGRFLARTGFLMLGRLRTILQEAWRFGKATGSSHSSVVSQPDPKIETKADLPDADQGDARCTPVRGSR